MADDFPESLEERVKLLADVEVSDISQRYRMNGVLGSGAQATVYAGVSKKSQKKVAIKVLDAKELEDDELFDALRMEINILKQIRHPYVVQLIEVVRDPERVYIIQECLGGGELFEQLLAKGPFKEDYALAIFAQVAIAVDHLHGLDVVHRDLKAENLVFAAKGSPIIKFIDFGGASTWTADEGLTGLVGTPQYVAPEVVTGYGEVNPTGEPYGKGCDLWSMGVLLYVMLSKTMPFRAKEVYQLLKQVVKGKFAYKPEDRWKGVSDTAKDLITKLLCKDPTKRLTISQVKEHEWCRDAIKRCAENMPKLEAEKRVKDTKSLQGNIFKPMLSRIASGANRAVGGGQGIPSSKIEGKPKNKGVSREQQYWYAMEISPPSDMKKDAGVKVDANGKFQMDNVPPEMKAMLEEIERAKAAKEAATSGSVNPEGQPPPPPLETRLSSGPPPPPGGGGAPPPPPGPPPENAMSGTAAAHMQVLTTENEAKLATRSSETMDTLLLMSQKDSEIMTLREQLQDARDEIAQLKLGGQPPPSPVARGMTVAEMADASPEAMKAMTDRAEKAEEKLSTIEQQMTKLQAKLNAVSTLYTEAAQREAVLRIQLEQAGSGAQPPSYQ